MPPKKASDKGGKDRGGRETAENIDPDANGKLFLHVCLICEIAKQLPADKRSNAESKIRVFC